MYTTSHWREIFRNESQETRKGAKIFYVRWTASLECDGIAPDVLIGPGKDAVVHALHIVLGWAFEIVLACLDMIIFVACLDIVAGLAGWLWRKFRHDSQEP